MSGTTEKIRDDSKTPYWQLPGADVFQALGSDLTWIRVKRLPFGAVVRRKRMARGPREPLALPTHRDKVWSMDFVVDVLANG